MTEFFLYTIQVVRLVLVREITQMELVVVLDMVGEGDLDFTMGSLVKVVRDMVAPIFLVNWVVELRVIISLKDMWLVVD